MSRSLLILLGLLCFAAGCGPKDAPAVDEHGHEVEAGHEEEGHEEEGHEEESHAEEEGHSDHIELTAEAAKIAGIETGVVRRVSLQSELTVTGVVATTSNGRAIVTPPVAGKITRLLVAPGQNVRAGQGIAVIQSPELAEAAIRVMDAQRSVTAAASGVKEAESETALARNTLKAAEENLSRQRQLVRTGAFSQPALLAAERELNTAKAELETAEQEEVVHLAQLERAERLYKLELISRTELEEARLELQRDKTRQETARKQIAIAKANFDREVQIAERGLLNAREIQAAEADVRAAKLAVEQRLIRVRAAKDLVAGAQKGVRAAQQSYRAQAGGSSGSGGTITVSAPISGVVTRRTATLGQAVERTTEICEIENHKSIWVTASVPERSIGIVRKGAAATVKLAAYPTRTFRGVIQVVETRLDPKTRTMPVQILVENADGALKPEMFASVMLGTGTAGMALTIPKSAVVDGDTVYLAEDDHHFEERKVVLGRTQGDLVEVLEGLAEGDVVVVKGAFVLKSEKVKGELKGHEH